MLETYHRGKKQLDSAPPGGEKKTPGRWTQEKQTKTKKAPPGLQNEEAELLPFVQYSPSLHNLEW